MGAAFATAIVGTSVFGDKKVSWGTFTPSGGSEGGNIDTGLKSCEGIELQYTGSSASTDAPVYNETFPCDGSAVTIVTVADTAGIWFAWGS
ncbi:MAG: hypothetical protein BWY95_00816 [Bacteroidetes bacterium ADurb.BinA104]|jgi:hypothetical protein|nr:MAG: hypothetical protein BWY95_00816 [Bacteroidetes bacterium ADurb.BinA104]